MMFIPFSQALWMLSISASLGLALPAPEAAAASTTTPPALPLRAISASNTGASALPTPTSPPKYVLLGIGYQNYTCDGAANVQSLPSDGAIADLYDVTAQLTQSNVDTISAATLKSFESCLNITSCKPDKSANFCEACHDIAIAKNDPYAVKQVGFHFFDHPAGSQVPNFDVYSYGDFLSAKKVGDVKAPAGSYAGSNGLGAIDWLYLPSNTLGRTHGLSSVYRVETAGGVAPKTCSKSGQQTFIPYVAEYWFYK